MAFSRELFSLDFPWSLRRCQTWPSAEVNWASEFPTKKCPSRKKILLKAFPGRHLALRHSELICDQLDPLEEVRWLDWDLPE